ncbi:uracil phosphoribosyltransferase [Gaetbulibacter sp. M240]|uniref:uracil phosphoribosyltransferase n=1 Tax=Gaetbulibacter sp. M240 TaxID=3126511 RepID=UPI00374E4F73
MHIHNLSQENSVLNTFISEIRSKTIQTDRMRFRRNIERIGEILSYEMSKMEPYKTTSVETPLGTSEISILHDDIVLCSVLRAGIPLHYGILNYFDKAENAFISAYRHHEGHSDDFEIIVEYLACPDLNNKTLILADPMLATGQSMVSTFAALQPYGKPKAIHLMSVIGAQEGIDFVAKSFPEKTHLWIATVDETLNSKGYIVPGLGDAGDLSFGEKLQK